MPLLSDSNQIPVVTGYLGHITGGIVNAIGRGYSDLTAALTATALNASELQVGFKGVQRTKSSAGA